MGNLVSFGIMQNGEVKFGESLTSHPEGADINVIWDGEDTDCLFVSGDKAEDAKKGITSKWGCRSEFLQAHEEALSERRHAWLKGFDAKDDCMSCLQYVPGLVTLWIRANASVTDEVMMGLVYLRNLETLNINECHNVTDAGVENAVSLSKLKRLFLSRVGFTDAALELLSYLSQLRELQMSWTGISSEGLEYLSELPLENLDVTGTAVSSLDAISKMTSLKQLNLSDTQIGDNDIAKLNSLVNLELLLICNTKITDAGLKLLVLPKLKYVNAKGTTVGLRQLGDARIGVSRECYRY